jgi:hypothetical protein
MPTRNVVNVDRHPAFAGATAELKQSGDLSRRCRCRPSPYLKNVIEQDHRFIKKRIADPERADPLAGEGRRARAAPIHPYPRWHSCVDLARTHRAPPAVAALFATDPSELLIECADVEKQRPQTVDCSATPSNAAVARQRSDSLRPKLQTRLRSTEAAAHHNRQSEQPHSDIVRFGHGCCGAAHHEIGSEVSVW